MRQTDHSFAFDLPDGWEDQTVYTLMGPEDSGVQHSLTLNIDRHLQHDDIRSFAQEKTEPIAETLQGVEILKNEETTIEGGNPTWEFVYKWVPGNGQVMFQKHVFVLKDGMGFSFSAGFSRKTLKTVGLQMKDIIESLVPGTYEPVEEE